MLAGASGIAGKVQFLYATSTVIAIIFFVGILIFYFYLFKKVTTTIEQAHDVELLRGTVMEEIINLKNYEKVEASWNKKFDLEPPQIDRDPFRVVENNKSADENPQEKDWL